jgi:outer membrane receptor protein involved in Fe transport
MGYHKMTRASALAMVLMGSGSLIASSAHAQNAGAGAPQQADYGIADIIVTAQKRAQSINDVGLTITALGSDTLDKQGIKTLEDLSKSVPGLTYAVTDFGTPIFTLRGVGFYDNSLGGYPTTSVYVDEVPLPFPVMASHANLDLERVEVLKGPQGTLFGQNSTGGAINYIAAKPTDVLAAGIDVTVGRFGQGEANGFISGPITETLGVRLSGQYDYGSPWQRSYTRDDSLGRRNAINGRLLVDWKPTDTLKITLNLNGWRDRSDPRAGQFVAIFPQISGAGGTSAVLPLFNTYPFSPEDPRAADWDPDHRPRANHSQFQAALRADLDLTDDIVLTSIASYVRYKTNQRLDLDATTGELFQYLDKGNIRSFTQELRLAGGEGTAFRWVVGGNYEKSSTYERTHQTYGDSTIRAISSVLGNNFTNQDIRNYAIFANGEYDIISGVTFKAGARYTNTRNEGNLCTFGSVNAAGQSVFAANFRRLVPGAPVPPLGPDGCTVLLPTLLPGPFIDTLKDNNVSWRVGVDYKASRDLLLYVNVAKGYKAGNYPTSGATIYTSYLPVKAEALLDYEAGFKAKFLDHKLGLNGAVFYYDYSNKQLLTKQRDPIAGLIPRLENVPKSRVKGIELEMTAKPFEGLSLSGGVTYLDAEITKYIGVNSGGATADFKGTAMPFTPKWQYSATVDYDFPAIDTFHPFVGASLTGRTSTTSIVGSAVGAIIRPGFRSLVPVQDIYDIPSRTILDLRAGIEAEDGSWRLMVWGKNVTNKYYWTNITAAFEGVTRWGSQPATYGVTFGYKFGQ